MSAAKDLPKNWVLVRGLARSQFHWKDFGTQFKKNLQLDSVQTVELPGNGFLRNEETSSDIDQVITQLRSQINLAGKLPIGIIAISLGGILATKWAQLYPEEVSLLVIINSSSRLSPFYKRLLPKNYLSIIKSLTGSSPSVIEKYILNITSNNKKKWQAQLAENVEFLKQYPVSLNNFFRQLKLTNQVDFKQIPKAKKLILVSKNDRFVSYTCSELIAKIWDCEIHYHETAGHDLPLDDSDWIINQIAKLRY